MQIIILASGRTGVDFAADVAARIAPADALGLIVNTAGDLWAHGLKVCPDLDAALDRFGDVSSTAPTFATCDAINALGIEPSWLRSHDRGMALQIVRTELLQAGFTLTQATDALATRTGVAISVIPVSDDRIEQHRVVESESGSRAIHIREYQARGSHDPEAPSVLVKAEDWDVSERVIEALDAADVIVVAPQDALITSAAFSASPGLRSAIERSTGHLCQVTVAANTDSATEEGMPMSNTHGPIVTYADIGALLAAAARTAS